ncbi:MAG: spore germination protein [Ectobacillus sp.]
MEEFRGEGAERVSETTKQQNLRRPLSRDLHQNLKRIQTTFESSHDVVIRQLKLGAHEEPIVIAYTDGLADAKAVNEFILDALTSNGSRFVEQAAERSPEKLYEALYTSILTGGELKRITDFQQLFLAIMTGETVVLLNGCEKALAVSTKGWKDRGVTEPAVQNVLRGPRESFSESLRTNTALVRRRIRDENLCCEQRQIGRVTKTDIAVMYIKGIADEGVVAELYKRLDRIDIDGILESGYIEEFIQDATWTPFPTVYNTERPDIVAAAMLEGRVAILVDGTPFALLIPVLFGQFFQAAEDYYERSIVSTLLRLMRYMSLFVALLAPSSYIAITTFHQEMLPTQLLISLASQREGIPFPAFVEAVIMEVMFEVLREAGIRMPRPMGQAISIVGALVIGQAAVEAGFVSAAMVIVVAITAISNFVFPAYNMAIPIRILRFLMMVLAATFGLFGITMGLIVIVLHLCSLRSFGVAYMAPFSPMKFQHQKDMFMRAPHWALNERPDEIAKENKIRNKTPKPSNPSEETEKKGNS